MGTTATRTQSKPQLYERLRSGDTRALADLYERYAKVVYNVAYRFVGTAEEAEDVLQDVFVGLPDVINRFEGRGSFEGWLKRIAARTSLTRIRVRKRRAELPIEGQANYSRRADTPSADRMAIEDALDTLPNTLRVAFILKIIEGYSYEEVAEMLDIEKGAAKVRVHRARQQLQRYLRSQ